MFPAATALGGQMGPPLPAASIAGLVALFTSSLLAGRAGPRQCSRIMWKRNDWTSGRMRVAACGGHDTLGRLARLITNAAPDWRLLSEQVPNATSADTAVPPGTEVSVLPLIEKFGAVVRDNILRAADRFFLSFGSGVVLQWDEQNINANFDPTLRPLAAQLVLDCKLATRVCFCKGMIDSLNPTEFDRMAHSLGGRALALLGGDARDAKAGDMGYFSNFRWFVDREVSKGPRWASPWIGQWVIARGNGEFFAHGLTGTQTADSILAALAKEAGSPPDRRDASFGWQRRPHSFYDIPAVAQAVFDQRLSLREGE